MSLSRSPARRAFRDGLGAGQLLFQPPSGGALPVQDSGHPSDCFAWMRDGCGDVVLLPPFVPRNSVSGLDQGEGVPVMGAVFDSVPVSGFNAVKARGDWFELVKGIRRNR